MSNLVTIAVLNFNRPKETELCLRSIQQYAQFKKEVILVNNGGEDSDIIYSFYKQGLIDKLILRKENKGCGWGTRECYNDFNPDSDWILYVQCDQFMGKVLDQETIDNYIKYLENKHAYCIDLAGNQGRGRFSERASLMNKSFYNSIPNTVFGPGPMANGKWTEQVVQEYFESPLHKYKIALGKYCFFDNGKESIRDYPCGGRLKMFTDSKQVFIEKPITKRIDFPNVAFSDSDWEKVLNGTWTNGAIPEGNLKDSFVYWPRPYEVSDFKQ
jgi:glycosyltransferase involved in cell wall biosynthesis